MSFPPSSLFVAGGWHADVNVETDATLCNLLILSKYAFASMVKLSGEITNQIDIGHLLSFVINFNIRVGFAKEFHVEMLFIVKLVWAYFHFTIREQPYCEIILSMDTWRNDNVTDVVLTL